MRDKLLGNAHLLPPKTVLKPYWKNHERQISSCLERKGRMQIDISKTSRVYTYGSSPR